MAVITVHPKHEQAFYLLIQEYLSFWCDHPDLCIKKLYTFAIGEEDSVRTRLIRELYFAPRYDLGEGAWELHLDHYNPSPMIQHFQQCLQQKKASQQ
jgi:hypothetical protein